MHAAGFELIMPANEQPQTHALDLAATVIGQLEHFNNIKRFVQSRGLYFYGS